MRQSQNFLIAFRHAFDIIIRGLYCSLRLIPILIIDDYFHFLCLGPDNNGHNEGHYLVPDIQNICKFKEFISLKTCKGMPSSSVSILSLSRIESKLNN